MNPIRLFVMLSQKASSGDPLKKGSGQGEMNMETAAALCAGMPEHWYKAAVYKWALDTSVRQWLRIELWRTAMELAQREGWRTGKRDAGDKPITLSLAELALDEMEDPAMRGRATWQGKERWQKLSNRLGVSRHAWYKTWQARYQAIYQVLDDWAGNAYLYVAKRQDAA